MDELELPRAAIQIVSKQKQLKVGIAIFKKIDCIYDHESDRYASFSLSILEFVDNEQHSNLDSFINQIGNGIFYVSEEFQDRGKNRNKKLASIFSSHNIEPVFVKKSTLAKKPETVPLLLKLAGRTTHTLNTCESEMPIALGCVECLANTQRFKDNTELVGKLDFSIDSIDAFMKLDSSACDATNLFPKPDHPSQFGSIFGVLNRCKTKMGTRLLDR